MPMVDVTRYRVMVEMSGWTGPAVVLVAQWGSPGSDWAAARTLLPAGMLTISYDRAGIAGSDSRPDPDLPVAYSGFANELATVLDALRVPDPYVLVGHSFGGLIVRTFTAAWPDRVAGLVLVDGSVPELYCWPGERPDRDGDRPTATLVDVAAGAAELADEPPVNRPAIVLTRMPGWRADAARYVAADRFWQHRQRQLAVHHHATQIIATTSGHQIPQEAPTLVALAISTVVTAARTGRPLVLDAAAVAACGGRLAEAAAEPSPGPR